MTRSLLSALDTTVEFLTVFQKEAYRYSNI